MLGWWTTATCMPSERVSTDMASFPCLLPLLYATQLVAMPAQPEEKTALYAHAAAGLPIIYTVEGKAIEVPIGTSRIAWKPEPLRDLTVALLEPPRAGDDIVGEDVTEEDIAPIPIEFRAYALKSECFDLCIYGDITEEQRMIWLLAALSTKVMAARERGLSAVEEEKLILAGRGDIKRFFDRVKAQRPGFEERGGISSRAGRSSARSSRSRSSSGSASTTSTRSSPRPSGRSRWNGRRHDSFEDCWDPTQPTRNDTVDHGFVGFARERVERLPPRFDEASSDGLPPLERLD